MSGILLFACVFLPAVKGCNHPVMPYEFPPFLPPYLYGLVFAAIAMAGSRRGVMCGVLALRVLATLVVTGSIVLFVVAPPVGAIELMIGTMLFAIVGLSGTTEARIAGTGVTIGLISTLWFGFWALTSDALLGVYLSLASSAGLLTGSLLWLRELLSRPAIDVPRAVAARRARADNDILVR
ncbi:MAG TPA: hypothetical protein VGD80_00575 [Kofleriaceae bacterium]